MDDDDELIVVMDDEAFRMLLARIVIGRFVAAGPSLMRDRRHIVPARHVRHATHATHPLHAREPPLASRSRLGMKWSDGPA